MGSSLLGSITAARTVGDPVEEGEMLEYLSCLGVGADSWDWGFLHWLDFPDCTVAATDVLDPFFLVAFLLELVGAGEFLFDGVLSWVVLGFFVGGSLGGVDESRFLFPVVESVGLPFFATVEGF